MIALELTETIRKSVTIDWTQRESVRAELRLRAKKILRNIDIHLIKREWQLKWYSNRQNL